jgi:pimeloyl-ACP methyl ester carboxylesterase
MGAMAAKIPGARHVTIPRVGHLSNLEAPEKFNAVLADFLQSIR